MKPRIKMKRTWIYIWILAVFYTFLFVFSWLLGMMDVIFVSVVVSLFSFLWFLIYTRLKKYQITGIRDFVVVIFIYFFINFYITFLSLLFSGKELTELRLMLVFSCMIIWLTIMFDFYFHSMKGEI